MPRKKKKLTLPEKMVKFIETLRQPTGDGVGAPMKLMQFQKEMISEVYGNLNPEGNRIVNEAVLSIGRKNGKSSLCSAIVLCHFFLPELSITNQEILLLAWTREQAGALFKSIAEFIKLDEELIHDFSISDSRKTIKHIISGGECRIESAEAASLHGRNPSLVLIDEIGNFSAEKAREIYSVVTTGFGARKEALVWLLSTQAPTDNHIFSEKVDYVKMVNRGEIVDPRIKGFIYEIPEELDVYQESNWVLANPAIDVIRSREEMRKKADEAKRLPAQEAFFRQLFCNQRVDSFTPFITKGLWERNNFHVELSKLEGRVCYAGLDLSAKTDLTAMVLVFPSETEPIKFDVVSYFWKPNDTLRDHSLRDRVPYETWHKQGYLSTTPGNSISYDFVAKEIYNVSQKYQLKGIHYDRWAINNVKMALEAIGCPVPLFECGQGFKDMGQVVNCMEELILDGKLRAGKNPLLTWNIANSVCVVDPAGSRKFDKAKSFGRIDGTVALGMALRLWELNKHLGKSLYDDPAFYAYMTGSV
jgi:phage terminase large subunit-like protein